MKLVYDIAVTSIAVLIVIFSLIGVRFGVGYLLMTKFKRQFDWLVFAQTLISVAWVIIFGYISEQYFVEISPIQPYSFGSLFIRPVILLSSSFVSLWMYIRYKFEKTGRSDQWNLLKP